MTHGEAVGSPSEGTGPRTLRFDDIGDGFDAGAGAAPVGAGPEPAAAVPSSRPGPAAASAAAPVAAADRAARADAVAPPPVPASSGTAPRASSPRVVVFDDLAPPAPARAEPAPALPPRPRPGGARPAPTALAGAPAGDDPAARLSVGRALAGAGLSVAGVALGLAVLLWVTDEPRSDTVADGLGTSSSPPRSVETASPDAVVAAPAPAAPAPAVEPEPAVVAPPSPVVPVTVLNNSRRTGLAARAAERFRDGGWPVALTGNFRGRIPVTTVYYDPGAEASARAFAAAFEGVVRVRPRFATLPARGVVVVVTREFAA